MKIYKHHLLIFIALFIALFIVACNDKKQSNNLLNEVLVEQLKKNSDENIPPSKFVKNKKYLKLHADDNKLHFSAISKVILRDSNIYILDIMNASLLLYDLTGKGIEPVGKIGTGPEDYTTIADFDIDSGGNIYLIDGGQCNLLKFNKERRFISKTPLPFDVDIIKVLDNGNFLVGLSSWNKRKNAGAKVVLADQQLETLNVLAYYDEYVDNSVWISNYSFSLNEKGIAFNRPADNNIIQITKQGECQDSIVFNFGKEQLPNEEKKDLERFYHKLEKYNLLKETAIVEDDYIIGTFLMYKEIQPFFIDRHNKNLYLGKKAENIVGYLNKILITVITPGKDYDKDLPQDVKEHLDAGDFVLCMYEII